MNFKKIKLFCYYFLFFNILFSQNKNLTLERGYILLNNKNFSIKEQKINKTAQEFSLKSVKRSKLPKLKLFSGYEVLDDKYEQKGWNETGLKASYSLFDGGLNYYTIEEEKEKLLKEKNKLTQVYSTQRKKYIKNYFKVLSLKNDLKYQSEVLDILKEEKEEKEQLYKFGRISKLDYIKFKITLNREEKVYIEKKRYYVEAIRELSNLLNMDLSSFNLDTPLFSLEKYNNIIELDEKEIKNKVQNSSDSKIFENEKKISSYELLKAKSNFYPNIDLVGIRYFDHGIIKDNNYDKWRVSVLFTWNIFDWGETIANTNKNKKLEELMILKKEEENKKLQNKLVKLLDNIKKEKINYKLTKENVDLLLEEEKIVKKEVELGRRDKSEYLDFLLTLKNAKKELYDIENNLEMNYNDYLFF